MPALNNAPLEYVSKSMFLNVDEKPLNIFSVRTKACGHAVAPGRAGTWTVTSLFNADKRVVHTGHRARRQFVNRWYVASRRAKFTLYNAEAAVAHKVARFDMTATPNGCQTDESFYELVKEGIIPALLKQGYVTQ